MQRCLRKVLPPLPPPSHTHTHTLASYATVDTKITDGNRVSNSSYSHFIDNDGRGERDRRAQKLSIGVLYISTEVEGIVMYRRREVGYDLLKLRICLVINSSLANEGRLANGHNIGQNLRSGHGNTDT